MMKVVVVGVVALMVVGLLVLLGFGIYEVYKVDKWMDDCHESGKIVVGDNPWYCMTWEEAKERGVELEVG